MVRFYFSGHLATCEDDHLGLAKGTYVQETNESSSDKCQGPLLTRDRRDGAQRLDYQVDLVTSLMCVMKKREVMGTMVFGWWVGGWVF